MPDININQWWDSSNSTQGAPAEVNYGRLSQFKAEILNGFIGAHGIRSMAELGCGDGSHLGLFQVDRYAGYDASPEAVKASSVRHLGDGSKAFEIYRPRRPSWKRMPGAELALSLDAVYLLLEDDAYEAHMRDLFQISERFVAVYSNNTEDQPGMAGRIRGRRFTDWVERNVPDWTLCGFVPNRYPFDPSNPMETSFADFHFFSRSERVAPGYSCLLFTPGETAAAPPDQEAARLMMASRQFLGAKELDKSAWCLRQAAQNPRSRLQAVNALGAVLGALGRHQEAEEAMKAVLARDAGNAQARINITKLYLRLGRWEDLNPFVRELRAMREKDMNVAASWRDISSKVENLR
jgi:tetratricopeptide (TPR) repeat protein